MITKVKGKGVDLNKLPNDKMRRFALEYMVSHDGTDAAIKAGYSKRSASPTASRLLKHPLISKFIAEVEQLDVEELELDRQEVLIQLYYALTRQVSDFVDPETGLGLLPHKLPKRVQSIVDGFEQDIEEYEAEDGSLHRRIKMKYKITPHATAREQALKHKGLFAPDRVVLDTRPMLDLDQFRLGGDVIDVSPAEQRLLEEEKKK